MMDLLPSIDPSSTSSSYPRQEDGNTSRRPPNYPKPTRMSKMFQDLVSESKSNGLTQSLSAIPKSQQSWSFKETIAQIELTNPSFSGATSLQEKIENVKKRNLRILEKSKIDLNKESVIESSVGSSEKKVALRNSRRSGRDGDSDEEFEIEEIINDSSDEGESDEMISEGEYKGVGDDSSESEIEGESSELCSDNSDDVDALLKDGSTFRRDQVEKQLKLTSNTLIDEEIEAALRDSQKNPYRLKSPENIDNSEFAKFFSETIKVDDKGDQVLSRSIHADSSTIAPIEAESSSVSFSDMNLSRGLLKSIKELGFTSPTAIQAKAIPLLLSGHDVCGSAVTGSGKTAAYLLPILERLLHKPTGVSATRVLILVPTRELATQVHSMCRNLATHTNLRASFVVGGVSLKAQEAELRTRPDILIATPGRLLDLLRNSMSVHCDDVDVLVLDEADRLLEMGFEAELHEILRMCPVGRQTILFSATMSARVESLTKLSLRKPVRVAADPLFDMAQRLVQEFVRIRPQRERDREAILLALLTRTFSGAGTVVFSQHRRSVHRLAVLLGMAGISVAELHGDLTQRQRLQALEDFRDGKARVLVATDLAGRGLDIAGVRAVINLEMPRDLASYVHRVGRTARAGRAGIAVTLVSERDRLLMKEVVKRAALNVRTRAVPPDVIDVMNEQIRKWEPDIQAVFALERSERELRLAEMELNKATNRLEHADEIKSRPARSWFQSEGEKLAAKEEATKRFKEADNVWNVQQPQKDDGQSERERIEERLAVKDRKLQREHDQGHRMTRIKRRRAEAERAAEMEAKRVRRLEKEAERAAGGRSAGAAPDMTDFSEIDLKKAKKHQRAVAKAKADGGQYLLAKRAKAKARAAVVESGMSRGQVLKQEQRLKAAKKKAKRSAFAQVDSAPSAPEKEKDMRKGGKPAHHGFKSKAKHRRR